MFEPATKGGHGEWFFQLGSIRAKRSATNLEYPANSVTRALSTNLQQLQTKDLDVPGSSLGAIKLNLNKNVTWPSSGPHTLHPVFYW